MMKAKIEKILKEAFAPQFLQVTDDSHQHAGHNEQAKKGGTHFTVTIVSAAFTGKNLVARHRLVYDALKGPIADGVHALAIHAKLPSE